MDERLMKRHRQAILAIVGIVSGGFAVYAWSRLAGDPLNIARAVGYTIISLASLSLILFARD
jgi:hypothetical protein